MSSDKVKRFCKFPLQNAIPPVPDLVIWTNRSCHLKVEKNGGFLQALLRYRGRGTEEDKLYSSLEKSAIDSVRPQALRSLGSFHSLTCCITCLKMRLSKSESSSFFVHDLMENLGAEGELKDVSRMDPMTMSCVLSPRSHSVQAKF